MRGQQQQRQLANIPPEVNVETRGGCHGRQATEESILCRGAAREPIGIEHGF
jgi:hypothetical protein